MNEKQTHLDWRFGAQWLVTCAIGTLIGLMAGLFSMWQAGEVLANAIGDTVAGLVAGALFGGLLALGANVGPGLLLQRSGVSAARWIGVSAAAGAVGMGLTFALAFNQADALSRTLSAVLVGLAVGLPVGIGQWLVLRQRGTEASGWIVVSVLAYLLVGVIIASGDEDTSLNLAVGITGLLLGAVTGLGMVWLRRRETAIAA